jgi:hypothetical protein
MNKKCIVLYGKITNKNMRKKELKKAKTNPRNSNSSFKQEIKRKQLQTITVILIH